MVIALDKGGIFFFFATLNMLNLLFSLWIPETIKLSLEQVDVIFGSVTKEERMRAVKERFDASAAGLHARDGQKDLPVDDDFAGDDKKLDVEHQETVKY